MGKDRSVRYTPVFWGCDWRTGKDLSASGSGHGLFFALDDHVCRETVRPGGGWARAKASGGVRVDDDRILFAARHEVLRVPRGAGH